MKWERKAEVEAGVEPHSSSMEHHHSVVIPGLGNRNEVSGLCMDSQKRRLEGVGGAQTHRSECFP